MKEPKRDQILFFVDGPVPSKDDLAAAEALGTKCFRNVRKTGAAPVYACRVAGAVPSAWAKTRTVQVMPSASPSVTKPQGK